MTDQEYELETPTVTLGSGAGAQDFEVIEQPHAYLIPKIQGVITAMFGEELNVTALSVAAGLGDAVYDVLTGFLHDLPERISRWEFLGYATAEEMKAGKRDEATARRTPTLPQIARAIDLGIEVNGRDVLEELFKVLDPKDVREMVGDRLRLMNDVSLLRISLNLPPTNGESDSTSSGGEAPIEPGIASA